MKSFPEDFDPQKYPDLACIQAILHDEDRTPEGWLTLVSHTLDTSVPIDTNE